MSRLQISLDPHTTTASRRNRYEDRLRRIAGGACAPIETPAPTLLTLLFKIITALALVAALAVSLAIWRIHDFPH
jgi:hypothetical protein